MTRQAANELGNPRQSIHTFIISWSEKHDNAARIVKAVAPSSDAVTVVYSDSNDDFSPNFSCATIKRPNDLFFGDKFRTCIESCNTDILLAIHADCDCQDWSKVVRYCRRAFEQIPQIGVWVPLINYTYWSLDRTEIKRISNSPFTIVAQTNAIVVGLTRPILNRMKKANYDRNIYGWGIDPMFNYCAYSIGMISVVDASIFVQHPKTREYPSEIAAAEQVEFLKQLTPIERSQSLLLDTILRLRDEVRQKNFQYSSSTLL
jgi:hypothetical protein